MSHYLSNIVARSNRYNNDNHSIIPVIPVNTADNHGIVQDFTQENDMQDNAGQNQFIQQDIASVQPTRLQNVQQPENIGRTENSLQEKNIVHSYFSKHIERVKAEQKERLEIIQPHETGSFKIEELTKKIATKGSSEKSKVNETIFDNKIISNIIPGNKGREKQTGEIIDSKPNVSIHYDEIIAVKRQTINPSVKDEDQKKSKLQPNSTRIEILMPSQPNQEKPRQFLNKTNQANQKLIIGKIIVEILPPKLPVPQKLITRVVQSSSKDSHSKSNKLIFGLGQL